MKKDTKDTPKNEPTKPAQPEPYSAWSKYRPEDKLDEELAAEINKNKGILIR